MNRTYIPVAPSVASTKECVSFLPPRFQTTPPSLSTVSTTETIVKSPLLRLKLPPHGDEPVLNSYALRPEVESVLTQLLLVSPLNVSDFSPIDENTPLNVYQYLGTILFSSGVPATAPNTHTAAAHAAANLPSLLIC